MNTRGKSRYTRRDALKALAVGSAAVGSSALFSAPAVARTTKIEYTLSWLPVGQYAFMSVAQRKFLKPQGIEFDVKRGYGSLAATQAVATGKFNIGDASTAGNLLSVLRGLSLELVACHGYDSTMGVLVPANGPIKSPKDLEGKKIGVTAAGGDTPFLPAYYKLVGVDPHKVTTVALDSQVIEQAVISKQVDCMVAFGMSSIPNFITQHFPVRFFPFSRVGLTFYWVNTIVRPQFLQKEPNLVADIVHGLLEAQKFALLHPEQTVEMHMKQYPEIAISNNGKLFTELGVGMANAIQIVPETEKHMLGYQPLAAIGAQAKRVKNSIASLQDKTVPPVTRYCTNKYVGALNLSAGEWQTARIKAQKYAKILGLTA